jgi:hypothetical protein
METSHVYYRFDARAFGQQIRTLSSESNYETLDGVMDALRDIPLFNQDVFSARVIKVIEVVVSTHAIPLPPAELKPADNAHKAAQKIADQFAPGFFDDNMIRDIAAIIRSEDC